MKALTSASSTTLDRQGNRFDLIRLCLASLVMYSHSFLLTGGLGVTDPLSRLTRGAVNLGEVAVDGFFAISGLLVSQSWLRSDGLADYARRRLLRIVPAFIAAALFTVLIVLPLGAEDGVAGAIRQFRPLKFLASLVLFREYKQPGMFVHLPYPGAVNGSLWTIQFECWCYVSVPLLGAMGMLKRRWGATLALAGCLALYAVTMWRPPHLQCGWVAQITGNPVMWPRLFTWFAGGAVLGVWLDDIPVRGVWAAVAALVLAFMGWVDMRLCVVAAPVFGTYVLYFLARSPGAAVRGLARRGDLSYGVYLYGFPVQQLVERWVGARIGPYGMMLLAWPAAALLAAASWRWIERPSLNLKRRWRSCAAEDCAALRPVLAPAHSS